MKLAGHRTHGVSERRAIVDEAMLNEAGAKLAAMAAGESSKVWGKAAK